MPGSSRTVPPLSPSRHIANLDAVRALAILLVMTFHARYLAFGWIGVWVFFVLSGFLITRSLIELRHASWLSGLKTFYMRRSLRIWPAYYLYLIVVGVPVAIGGLKAGAGAQLAAAAVYLSNLTPLLGIPSSGRVFSHLWSLAIEEQYYLLIAPLVLSLRQGRCIAFFVAGVLLVPLLRLAAFHWFQPAFGADGAGELIKLLTPLQFDSFMLGGLLALREDLVKSISGRVFAVIAAAIIAVVVASLVANALSLAQQHVLMQATANLDFSEMTDWRLSATSVGIAVDGWRDGIYIWLYSVLAFASFLLIATVIRWGGSVRVPLLNSIGKVSYGMYLYHMPLVSAFDRIMRILAIPKHSVLGVLCFAGLVGVTWGLAAISFAYVERPFLRLKDRYFEPRKVAPPPAIVPTT